MAKLGFLAAVLVFLLVLNPSAAFFASQRKLTTIDDSTNLQVPPTVSPDNQSDTNPIDAVKPENEKNKESQLTDKNNGNGSKTLPDDDKKDDDSLKSGDLNKPADEKNDSKGAGKKGDDNVKSGDVDKPADEKNDSKGAEKKDDDSVKSGDLDKPADEKNDSKGAGKEDDGSVKSTDLDKPADTNAAGKKDDGGVKSSDLNKPADEKNDTNAAGKKDDDSVKSSDLNKPADGKNGTNAAGKKDDDSVKSSDLNKPADGKNDTNDAGKKDDDSVKSDTNDAGKKDDDSVKSSDSSKPTDEKNDTNVAGKKDDDHGSDPHSDDKTGTKVDNGTSKPSSTNNDSCEGSLISCRDGEMVACIEASKDGSEELSLLVLNGGRNTLKVNVNVPERSNPLLVFEVPKHGNKRMHIESKDVGKNTDLIVNSDNTKCTLPLAHPVSVDYVIQQLSFYSRQVTPIYGAYTLFGFIILFGGTWACCKLRKKSRQDGIPYQELEMGLPESASAVNVDAADGWDHDWDDDWDEENSVRSPGGNQVRNISANGLTSRSPKTDGWEDDWDV